jgi:hypothetical protein
VTAPVGGSARQRAQPVLVVPFDVERTCVALALASVALVLVGVVTNIAYATADRAPDRFQRFVDVNAEGNLPTWFSVVLMSAGAVAVWVVAQQRRRSRSADAGAWYALAAVVALMSLDEMVSLHEAAGHVLRNQIDVPVLGKYAWIIPGAVATLFASRVLLRAVGSLPTIARRRLVGAASLFIGAALGIEVLEALLLNDDHNYLGDGMHVLTGAQECFEMLGAVLFLYAVLGEIRRVGPTVRA